MLNVKDFGAAGDGVADDRVAIQAALDQGHATGQEVLFPAGVYMVSRAGTAYFCLQAVGVSLRGQGATLRQMPVAASVQLLRASGAMTIRSMTFEGGQQTPNDHRHGVFADGTSSLYMEAVVCRGFQGDGIYLRMATDTTLKNVVCSGNARNGMTLAGMVDGVTADGCVFRDNGAQQVDSEPGGTDTVYDVVLRDCVLDRGASTDYALTISGTSTLTPGAHWTVLRCRINGDVFVVWAEDVDLAWCHAGTVDIWRSSARVQIRGCYLTGPVNVIGTTGSGPWAVAISGTRTTHVEGRGVNSMSVIGCTIEGEGPEAIYLRATVEGRPFLATIGQGQAVGFSNDVTVVGDVTLTRV